MFRKFALCCAAIVLAATPARATPPDVIAISDQVFALGEDKVFVLRTAFDNLGVYHEDYRETWLVGIDVATGEEALWLVYRGRSERTESVDPEAGRVVVTLLDRELWHDPMQIIGEAGAELVVGYRSFEPDESPLVPDAGGTYEIADDYRGTYRWRRDQALARADASALAFASRIADVPRMAPVTTRELLDGRGVIAESCTFHRLGLPRGVGVNSYQLLQADCRDDEALEFTSLIQAVTSS